MGWLNVLLALAIAAGRPPQLPPPFPRPGTTLLLDNDVVAVWNVSWLKQQYPLHTHRYDLVGVSYAEGDRIITQGTAPGKTRQHQGVGVSDEPRQRHARRGGRERSADACGAD